MAKFLSPADRPEFTPADQRFRPEAERIVYLFRVPSVADEARLVRNVRAAGGRRAGWSEILAEIGAAILSLPKDDPERLLAEAEWTPLKDAVDTAAAELRLADDESLADAERIARLEAFMAALGDPKLADLKSRLARRHPRLDALEAENLAYPLILGLEAARMFLVDWRGLSPPPRVGPQGLDEASLRRIPREHRIAIGQFVETLFGPSEAEEKNLSSPPGGPNDATRSTAASATTPPTPSSATPGDPTS